MFDFIEKSLFFSLKTTNFMSKAPEFVWFLNCLEDKCPIFALKHDLTSFKNDFIKGTYKDPTLPSHKFVTSQEPYAQFVAALFKEKPSKGAIPILRSHGYFMKGNSKLFDNNNPRLINLAPLYNCLMWAYLDVCLPKAAISKVIGRTKTSSCSDAESSLCMWVNTLVKRHKKLPVISTITQHFFGLPHFRMVLFHFLHEDQLFNTNQTAEENAAIAFERCTKLGFPPPFQPQNYEQPPLIIMCFLCKAVVVLSETVPPPPPPTITQDDVNSMLLKIEMKRKEVVEGNVRVRNLSEQVLTITARLKKAKRPNSTLAARKTSNEKEEGNGIEIIGGTKGQLLSSMRAKSSLGGRKTVTWNIPAEDLVKMQSKRSGNLEREKSKENDNE